jgi:hypothetical protein
VFSTRVTNPSGEAFEVEIVWLPRWKLLSRRFRLWRAARRSGTPDPETAASAPTGGAGEVGPAESSKSSGKSKRDLSWILDESLGSLTYSDGYGDFWAGMLFFVVVAVAVAVFWLLILPLLLLFLDGVVIALLLLVALAARVLFRRPWIVEVRRIRDGGVDNPVVRIGVIGWNATRQACTAVASSLESGSSIATATESFRTDHPESRARPPEQP